MRPQDPPPSLAAVESYARTLVRGHLEQVDVDLPEFPDGYGDYLRMGRLLGNLTPNEYLATSRLDYELSEAVVRAWERGEAQARQAHAEKGGE